MADSFTFLGIYETTIAQGPAVKVVSRPAKIEIFSGPRQYRVAAHAPSVVPAGVNIPLAQDAVLGVPKPGTSP